jgi:hypothetical protein
MPTGPFPGNIIPPGRLTGAASQIAEKMLSFYPAPNASGNGFNYSIVGTAPNTYSHWDARLDHDFTSNWHSFLRVSHFDAHGLGGNNLSDYGPTNPASQGFGGPDHSGAWSAAFNNTFTFSPTLLGELRYGVSRSYEKRTGAGGDFDPTTLGFPAYVSQTAGPQGQIFPRLNLGNGFSGLGPNGFNAFSQNPFAHDITGSIVKIVGSHSIKFGAEFRKIYSNFYQFGLPTGQYTVDSTWTQAFAGDNADSTGTGNPFAGFLLGLASAGDTDHTPTAASSSGYFATFIQDDWKATKHLTLNLGLRWDFEIPKTERFNKLSYWDPTLPSPLGSVTPAAGVNCPNCGNLLGQMLFPGSTGKFGRRQGPTQYKDFGPRIGFAYDAGHGLVFRSGFGLVFAPSDLQAAGTSGGVGNQGFQSQTQFAPTFDNQLTIAATLADPYPANASTGQRYNLPLGAAGGPSTQIGSGIGDSFYPSYRNPYNIQYNFSVQYALPGQTTFEAGYLGNHGLFLVDGDPGTNFDQLPTSDLALGAAALEQQVPNPFFGLISVPGSSLSNPTVQANQLLRKYPQYTGVQEFRKPTAESKYNAFTLRVNKHFSNGLSLLANFTGEKETDNSAAPVTFVGQVSSTRVNQYNPRAEWAVGPQDISRVFSAGYVYELPFGRGKRFLSNGGVLNRVVGGWQADGIIRWTTGTPVVIAGVGDQTDIFAGIGNGERPLWNGKSAKLNNPTHGEWFNTSVFSPLPKLTIGNAPRTIPNVRTPGLSNSDLSFFKNNYFGSDNRFNAQFRLDMFNAFNHPRWDKPDANVGDCNTFDSSGTCVAGNFGKITSVRNSSRQIQLAVKFIF